jgi:hypothetical protein
VGTAAAELAAAAGALEGCAAHAQRASGPPQTVAAIGLLAARLRAACHLRALAVAAAGPKPRRRRRRDRRDRRVLGGSADSVAAGDGAATRAAAVMQLVGADAAAAPIGRLLALAQAGLDAVMKL